MNRNKLWSVFLAASMAFVLLPSNLHAQSAPAGPPSDAGASPDIQAPPPPPPDGGIGIMRFEGELAGETVTGAPYSAQIKIEHAETLADGNRISRTTTGTVYRDAQGRTRREVTFPGIGPFATSNGPRQFIFINDPVAGFQYILHPDTKIADRIPITEGAAMKPFRYLLGEEFGQPQSESLGTRTVNGVQAVGTRTTLTIPAGRIGNTQPIQVVTEKWYSNDLHLDVMTQHSDPRFGTTTFELTDVDRSNPAPSLFQAPSDYTVKDMPARPRIHAFRALTQ